MLIELLVTESVKNVVVQLIMYCAQYQKMDIQNHLVSCLDQSLPLCGSTSISTDMTGSWGAAADSPAGTSLLNHSLFVHDFYTHNSQYRYTFKSPSTSGGSGLPPRRSSLSRPARKDSTPPSS